MTKKEMWNLYSSEFDKHKKCSKCYKLDKEVLIFKVYYSCFECSELYGESYYRKNNNIYFCKDCFFKGEKDD